MVRDRDERNLMVFNRRKNTYLVAPANRFNFSRWTSDLTQATLYSPEMLDMLKKEWPYINSWACEIIERLPDTEIN